MLVYLNTKGLNENNNVGGVLFFYYYKYYTYLGNIWIEYLDKKKPLMEKLLTIDKSFLRVLLGLIVLFKYNFNESSAALVS